ncbi:lipocalin family protein [Jannaschia aquimarina]|uniref:lipocalin family protein n=1 Tax=Jannaschia aquimarina TaxID=935700 RepID=UPI001F2C4083|nr:lipocalin family protein [Jannaschia aquimarina]
MAPLLPSYRDASVPIASKADFDPARFAGRWYQIAAYPVPFQNGCASATAEYAPRPDGTLAVRNTCLGPQGDPIRAITGTATPDGPGRLDVELSGVPFSAPLWILWTDADYRVAVLGQPDGRAGWILARDRRLRADLRAAARTVLEFNGYRLDALRETPPG